MSYKEWPTVEQMMTCGDEARMWARGAEEFLDEAVQIAGCRRDADEHTLLGVGFALLAIRSQLAATTGELATLADAVTAPRRPWWRRLIHRSGRRDRAIAAPEPVEHVRHLAPVPSPPDGAPYGSGATS